MLLVACSPADETSAPMAIDEAPILPSESEPSEQVPPAKSQPAPSSIYNLERVQPEPASVPVRPQPEDMAEASTVAAFGLPEIRQKARRLAAEPYEPSRPLPDDAKRLNYDQYRRILPVAGDMGWSDPATGSRVLFDPRGYLFDQEVRINIIDGDTVTPHTYSADAFDFKDLPLSEETRETLGFAGLRLLAPINKAGKFDEVLSFKGASFFRALGAGSVYGASARGLGIGTASADGEEFPAFREFWVVRPDPASQGVSIYALMDSPSVTGAFAFEVSAGPRTQVEVEATFFPRKEIDGVGLSPLTSMYYFSPHDVIKQGDDFRPAVHDSEGLAIQMSNGEWVWRPLQNPADLEVSVLAGTQPMGFGLLQRHRKFDDYSDVEAAYHQRPDVWVEPHGDWGEGQLMLVEIPTVNEYNDNIAVFWRPASGWRPGGTHTISYTMNWGHRPGALAEVMSVSDTRAGRKPGGKARMFVLDYEDVPEGFFENAELEISTSAGKILNPVMRRHPSSDNYRMSFELDPEGADMAELRAVVMRGSRPLTETWLYRWSTK
ncbi:MAG: glucan biosynthesis protein D [Hyphomonas sp.]|nr:MAG: glucan biosynthesis protein D [Hyphomonas sp.]